MKKTRRATTEKVLAGRRARRLRDKLGEADVRKLAIHRRVSS